MNLHLQAQNGMLALLRRELRDRSPNKRWTDEEIYSCINQALSTWAGRVSLPALYQPDDFSWSVSTLEYSLPNYIDDDIEPQQRVVGNTLLTVPPLTLSDYLWTPVHSWVIEAKADGTRCLRFTHPPFTTNARIMYWMRNSPMPTTVQTLNATITSSATSLVVASALEEIGDTGWVKIEAEYIQYSGVTRGASTTTLNNLVRGVNDSAAAGHNSTTDVYWCVAAPAPQLLRQLQDQTKAYLHQMFFTNGSPQEREMHGQMIQLFQTKADVFWRTYTPVRPYKMKLHIEQI